jgi:ribosomal protein S18 acetylase RimI-like enzyme
MSANLPAGYSWRRAEVSDTEAILSLLVELSTADLGYADITLDELRDDLAEPGFALSTDTWLVHDRAGAVAGYAWALARGTGENIDVDVLTANPELFPWCYERVLARATELAGDHPLEIYQGIYRQDTVTGTAAAAHGFHPVTAYHRMRVDHDGVVEPVAPAGVTLRRGPGDERFRRTAHAVRGESFKEHFGSVAVPFEQWHERHERESLFDWSMLTVAELDSRPVGILLATDRFVEAENCGYVGDLGVLAEARGRGIAKYLLRTAFAADAGAGRTGTILHVDANNVTPALGVYESVGMRSVLVIDMWRAP